MTLLSPLALLLGLTAAVPLILHLYQRRRRTVIEFSSNRFFTTAIIRSQRRLRLRRLLLLILRVAMCLLLALALAQPLMSLAGFAGGAGTRDVVLLLDDSLSMRARLDPRLPPPARRTRFELARRAALDVLAELEPGDRAAVLTFSGRALGRHAAGGLELADDPLRLAAQVARLQPTLAAGNAPDALARAAALLRHPAPRNRLVMVFSDLQAADWRQSDWPQPPLPVPLALLPIDTRGGGWENAVVDRLDLSQASAVVGQPSLLRVRLVNYRRAATPAELVLKLDGVERLRRPVELPGQSPHVERIPLVFDRPGTHRLEVRLALPAARDALPADNTFYASVRVRARLAVLLVDGQAAALEAAGAARRDRSAAFFLRAALRAVGEAILVEGIRPQELTAQALDRVRVVMLSAVGRLSLAQVELLEGFVRAGGGLAIFPGYYADRVFYNQVMGAATRPLGGLLPADLGTLIDSSAAPGRRPATAPADSPANLETLEPLHVLSADVEHPLLQRFRGTLRSALAGVTVYRAYATRPRDARVLAELDRNLPLLIERRYGRGRVLLSAVAPQPRWTNLPLRRLFVPLCSQAVSYLAGAGAQPADHQVGQDLELLRGGWDVARPVYYRRPDGRRARAAVKLVGATPVAYVPARDVSAPGFYQLAGGASAPAGAPRPQADAAAGTLAVNAPRRESAPAQLEIAAARKLAGKWHLTVVAGAGQGQAVAGGPGRPASLLRSSWLSRGIWDPLLWTVFVLVLAEPLLANQIIRLRRAARRPGHRTRAA